MALILKSIQKKFDDHVVLNNLSFTFENTGLYTLVGKSGSGKTTLLRILAGLESPDTGAVEIDGHVAVSFQEYRLLPNLTVLDNILLVLHKKPSEDDRASALAMLDRLSLRSWSDRFPSELSGGMKQRVSLARALLSNAPILLLDEPIKELDPDLAKEVCAILCEEAAHRLVIFTAHDENLPHSLGARIINVG